MADRVGQAWYELDARSTGLNRSLDQADRRITSSGDAAERGFFSRMVGGFGRIGGAAVNAARIIGTIGIVGGVALAGLGVAALTSAANMESMAVSWEVMLGSAEAAQTRMAELVEFAATTPFEIPEIMAASRTLQVFGGTALATGDNLRMVGDIAAGVQQPIGDVGMWIGRTYDAMRNGQPFGEAAMRLQEMGALSGEGRRELELLAESVANGSMTMEEAWVGASGVFGTFTGMMERQSQTVAGQFSNLKDAIGQAMTGAGQAIYPLAQEIIPRLIAKVTELKDWIVENMPTIQDRVKDTMEVIGIAVETAFAGLSFGFRILRTLVDDIGPPLLAFLQDLQVELQPALAEAVAYVTEHILPALGEAMEWIGTNVIPPLLEAFRGIGDWFRDNWPTLESIASQAIETITSSMEALWPILENLGRVILPALGVALTTVATVVNDNWPAVELILIGVAGVMAGMFTASVVNSIIGMGAALLGMIPKIIAWGVAVNLAIGPVGWIIIGIVAAVAALVLAWQTDFGGIRTITETVMGVVAGILGVAIGFFQEEFLPAIEAVGEAWGAIWTAVGGFFTGLWNGMLQFLGGIIGTIIGLIKGVVEVAAGIPGPWQEGARLQAAALGEMEAAARDWGSETGRVMGGSYAEQRAAAEEGGRNTARAYGDAFESQHEYVRQRIAAGLTPAKGMVYATSPPPDPQAPFHNVDDWATRTARAYGDAWGAEGAYIRSKVGAALDAAGPGVQLTASVIGAEPSAHRVILEHIIRDPDRALAVVPGGPEAVADILNQGVEALGFYRNLQHAQAVR